MWNYEKNTKKNIFIKKALLTGAVVTLSVLFVFFYTWKLMSLRTAATNEIKLEATLSNRLDSDHLQAQIITNIEGCSFKITSQNGAGGWTASDIFTVDETGLLKWVFVGGPADGKVTITAPDGQKFILKFEANLIDHCNFTKKEYELKVGESTQLIFNKTPWTSYPGFNSSDSDIVSVENDGKITAISPGVVTITGNRGFSADDKVTVYVAESEITTTTTTTTITTTTTVTNPTQTTTSATRDDELHINETEVTLRNGGQYVIIANKNDLTYKSNNTNVAVVSKNGTVTAVGEGNAIISVIDKQFNVVQLKVKVVSAVVAGDCNSDGELSIADVVMLQNWILGKSKEINDWKAADLCEDGIIDSFDLALIRRKLIYETANS